MSSIDPTQAPTPAAADRARSHEAVGIPLPENTDGLRESAQLVSDRLDLAEPVTAPDRARGWTASVAGRTRQVAGRTAGVASTGLKGALRRARSVVDSTRSHTDSDLDSDLDTHLDEVWPGDRPAPRRSPVVLGAVAIAGAALAVILVRRRRS
ncbi:hypothetical protein ACWDRR_42755 [Kitasatospora sp. NPDC003701]